MKDKILEILTDNQIERWKYPNDTTFAIFDNSFEQLAYQISRIVDKQMLDNKITIATLEAKVYAYEKIIANSNFKAILEEKESKRK